MLRNAFILVLLVFCLSIEAFSAGIEYVTVKTEGTGSTLGGAIGSALKEAITQVNGAQMAATSFTSETMAAVDSQNEISFASASVSSEQISAQTKGVVREYRILNKAKDGNIWNVSVDVTIAKYSRSEQAKRTRATVIPFRLTNQSQSMFRDTFTQSLTSQLTQSRKFAVLDRQYSAEQDAELSRLNGADVPVEEMAKLGNKLGTDLLIVGTIDDASVATHSVTIASVNKTLETSQSNVRVSYRVIDAPTGQIKFSDTWTRSQEGNAVGGMAEHAAEDIARKIMEAIFPIMVESVDETTVFLGQGGKALRVGQRYRLIRYGKNIVDSYTKESLGREETDVGIIEITDVQAKVAKGKVLKAQMDIAKDFEPGAFIARLMADAAPSSGHGEQAVAPKAPRQVKPQEGLSKSVEKDW